MGALLRLLSDPNRSKVKSKSAACLQARTDRLNMDARRRGPFCSPSIDEGGSIMSSLVPVMFSRLSHLDHGGNQRRAGVYREYDRGLGTHPCGAPVLSIMGGLCWRPLDWFVLLTVTLVSSV